MEQKAKLTIIVNNPPSEEHQDELFKIIEEYIQTLYQ